MGASGEARMPTPCAGVDACRQRPSARWLVPWGLDACGRRSGLWRAGGRRSGGQAACWLAAQAQRFGRVHAGSFCQKHQETVDASLSLTPVVGTVIFSLENDSSCYRTVRQRSEKENFNAPRGSDEDSEVWRAQSIGCLCLVASPHGRRASTMD